MLATPIPVSLVNPSREHYDEALQKMSGDYIPHPRFADDVWTCLNGVVIHGHVSTDPFGNPATSLHVCWDWRNGDCYVTIYRG
jgi:hypothetical protein